MRKIKYIVLHCSATKEGVPFGIEDIDRWHRQRGFRKVGYHYVILLDGTIRKGRDIAQVGAHVQGSNANSIGICYIGGLDADGKPKPLVAILWGRNAQSLEPLLTNAFIIKSPHPSPLSASRGFFGSKPFSRANQALVTMGADPVDWTL